MAQFDSVKAFIIAHALQWLGALIILIVGVVASKLSISSFGSFAVMPRTNGLPHPIQETNLYFLVKYSSSNCR